jgi:squalene-associated FAD-dependent desaturase
VAQLHPTPVEKIAVIGAGWAGCAAAVNLAKKGHQVTLIEAAKTLGGRARGVLINDIQLDNGQHILLGAYKASLDLCKQVGIDTKQALLRLPLQMCYPNADIEKNHGMHFVAPSLPAPLHLLIALLRAKGLQREDKMALARFSTTARWMDWRLHQDCSVTELLSRFDQTDNLCKLMWHPLCIAALNTPPERASAQVFLNVLRDSLGAKRADSDMLIPRMDLSALMPNAAANFIQQRGGEVITGCTVQQIKQNPDHGWHISSNHHEINLEQGYDAIVIATNPEQAKQLLATAQVNPNQTQPTLDCDFSYEPITTCYLQYQKHVQLARPFYALLDQPIKAHWGQFVFDRGQLHADQAGLLAVIVSASSDAITQSHEQLEQAITQQLAQCFQQPELATPLWQKTITEKRATFACSPALARPSNATSIANLMIAGDYTQGDYPATLEAAVQSGIKAAQGLLV